MILDICESHMTVVDVLRGHDDRLEQARAVAREYASQRAALQRAITDAIRLPARLTAIGTRLASCEASTHSERAGAGAGSRRESQCRVSLVAPSDARQSYCSSAPGRRLRKRAVSASILSAPPALPRSCLRTTGRLANGAAPLPVVHSRRLGMTPETAPCQSSSALRGSRRLSDADVQATAALVPVGRGGITILAAEGDPVAALRQSRTVRPRRDRRLTAGRSWGCGRRIRAGAARSRRSRAASPGTARSSARGSSRPCTRRPGRGRRCSPAARRTPGGLRPRRPGWDGRPPRRAPRRRSGSPRAHAARTPPVAAVERSVPSRAVCSRAGAVRRRCGCRARRASSCFPRSSAGRRSGRRRGSPRSRRPIHRCRTRSRRRWAPFGCLPG